MYHLVCKIINVLVLLNAICFSLCGYLIRYYVRPPDNELLICGNEKSPVCLNKVCP